jgi:hypothetical protein
METLTNNLIGTVEYKTLNGRRYAVAPLTLIVPGVLNGSSGALFYPTEEIARNVQAWNGVPLTVDHPQSFDGQFISGRTSEALDKHGIGVVLNASEKDGKLVAEGWFDLELTAKLAPSILDSLNSSRPIELSTGLFTKNEKAPQGANFMGTPYDFIARSYRPDHLAVLPNKVGACSVNDGCGVLVNENDSTLSEGKTPMALTDTEKTKIVDNLIANCECRDESDRERLLELDDEKLLARNEAMDKTLQNALVVNELQELAGKDVKPVDFASVLVNKKKAKNAVVVAPDDDEEDEEDDEKDPKFLAFKKNKTKNKAGKKMATNAVRSTEEWLESAPEEVRNAFKYSQDQMTEAKQKIIAGLVANVADEPKRVAVINTLQTKSLDELEILGSLQYMAPTAQTANRPSFFGQVGAAPTNNEINQDDLLEVPTMNFESDE